MRSKRINDEMENKFVEGKEEMKLRKVNEKGPHLEVHQAVLCAMKAAGAQLRPFSK